VNTGSDSQEGNLACKTCPSCTKRFQNVWKKEVLGQPANWGCLLGDTVQPILTLSIKTVCVIRLWQLLHYLIRLWYSHICAEKGR